MWGVRAGEPPERHSMAAEWREDVRAPMRQVARRPSGFAGDPQREGTSVHFEGPSGHRSGEGPGAPSGMEGQVALLGSLGAFGQVSV